MLMNIIGTCTQCSDIYFDSMMSAFDDFIRRHCLESVQSTSGRRHRDSKSTSYAEGSILDSRIMSRIQSSLELRERYITGKHTSYLRYNYMRRCPLFSTRG